MTFPDATLLLAGLAPWFDASRRPMPWRAEDLDAPHPDPYRVLVSEVMLQQTQVATVIPYFLRWMEAFPDPAALAAAGEEEVHGLWAGLGYYRRARNLQRAAAAIHERGWPRDLEGLLELPGLGPYTAAAIASQAFLRPEPALDGNAFRVAARVLGLAGDPRKQAKALRAWLAPALASLGPSRMTQAVMELGATRCTPVPNCRACPLGDVCEARRSGQQAIIPPVAPRARVREVEIRLAAIRSSSGWLLRPPSDSGLLAGLWSWPWVEVAPGAGSAEPRVPWGFLGGIAKGGWTQVYTHRRERVRPLVARVAPREAAAGLRWVPAADLAALPLGRRDQRLREALGNPEGAPLEGDDLDAVAAILGVAALPGPAKPTEG
jgi:A/G-specific adenine glycosylase